MGHTHTDREFRTLLDWAMVSDPWPLTDEDEETVKAMLNGEAHDRGYDGWVQAYHEHGVA